MEENQVKNENSGERKVLRADDDEFIKSTAENEGMQFQPEDSGDVQDKDQQSGAFGPGQSVQHEQALAFDGAQNDVEQEASQPDDARDASVSDAEQSGRADSSAATTTAPDYSQWPFGRKLNDQEANLHLE